MSAVKRCYQLKVVSDFASAHSLHNYPGDCRRLHGHNWKVEVEVSASALNELGIAIDFKALRHIVKKVTDRFDHFYLNDIPPFDKENPTAENIAAAIYQGVAAALQQPHYHSIALIAVTLWETERACVRYSEELIHE
ncbi:MAG: 6-carboxytetrahydropterin synthase QueD [Gammaproteobacteria bacterium]|nr:6-carboxytetrahydropterin synthase QueD [Gammaproteobacteria bacterium]